MKKSKLIKFVFLVVLGFAGYYYFSSDTDWKTSSTSERTEFVENMDLIQSVTIAGNVVPAKKTLITAPFNGYVKKLYVKIGQIIKKGDPLVSVVQSLQSIDPVFPLRSPLSGTVVSVQKQEGEFVPQDDPAKFILRIDDLSEVFVNANVAEIDMVKIKVGDEAIVKASAILGREYIGEVVSISLASKDGNDWRSNSKVEFPVRIKIIDPDSRIKSGMSAVLDIVTTKKENVLVLPHEFVFKDEDKFFVSTMAGERKEITIGLQNETHFEIHSGLSQGEEVQQIDFVELMKTNKK